MRGDRRLLIVARPRSARQPAPNLSSSGQTPRAFATDALVLASAWWPHSGARPLSDPGKDATRPDWKADDDLAREILMEGNLLAEDALPPAIVGERGDNSMEWRYARQAAILGDIPTRTARLDEPERLVAAVAGETPVDSVEFVRAVMSRRGIPVPSPMSYPSLHGRPGPTPVQDSSARRGAAARTSG
jgi:hypothetical protein